MSTNMSDYCASLQPKSLAENFDPLRLNIESLIPLSYGIPSSLLSITVIYILLCQKGRKEFQGSFYRCFAWASIIDLITWWHLLMFRELCTAPLLDTVFSMIPEAGFVAQWAYASQIVFTIAALINPVVLSLNRFVGLVFYIQDKQIWRHLKKLIFAAYLFFPFVFTWQIFIFLQPIKKCRIQNFNSTDAYHTFNLQPPTYFVHIASICAYTIFTSGFINFVINLSTICVMLHRRSHDASKNTNNKKKRNPELKLFFVALIGCFNVLLEVVYYTLLKVLPNSHPLKPAIYESLPFILDWYYLSPVWTILILCPTLRKRLFKVFKNEETTTVKIFSVKQSSKF